MDRTQSGVASRAISFSCLDQYLSMAFAQLTYRESLRDIETRLRAQRAKLYHMASAARYEPNSCRNVVRPEHGRCIPARIRIRATIV